jgi:Domain of unknown function (DUF4189)
MNRKPGPLPFRLTALMKNAFVSLIGLTLASGYVHAEGNCPKGYYPYNATGAQVACAPIPGYGGSNAPSDPGPQWQTRWGAIATTNGAFGAANDMPSKRKATREALKSCRANGGQKCTVKMTFYNQCGALAWGDAGNTTFNSPELKDAEESAVKGCNEHTRNCRVFYSACSYPARVR